MKKYNAPKNRVKRHTELKTQSLKRPGVKEMIAVYNLWRESHKAEQVHQVIKNFSYIIAYSNSSEPKSFLLRN